MKVIESFLSMLANKFFDGAKEVFFIKFIGRRIGYLEVSVELDATSVVACIKEQTFDGPEGLDAPTLRRELEELFGSEFILVVQRRTSKESSIEVMNVTTDRLDSRSRRWRRRSSSCRHCLHTRKVERSERTNESIES